MNRNVLSRRVLAGVTLAALALAGCSSNDGGGSGSSGTGQLSGAVRADGSSTVGPLTEAAASIYKEERPNVNVAVGISGTGAGFEKFCKGETDISDASRPIKETEKAACASAGIEFVELVVANDALSVVVNKDNGFVDCLTTAELGKIWEPAAERKITNWSQVRAGFPDQPLELFGPGTDSGTFDYFTGEINGEEGASRSDYEASEDDNVLVQGVAGSKGGLGYFGFTYYEENRDKLKVLQVDGGSGCVTPSLETAQNGSYKPLSRPLFIYVNSKAVQQPQVADFVDFYIENIDEVVKEAAYIPLTQAQKDKLKADFDAFKQS